MNITLLNKSIRLENERAVLLPFEDKRNQELKEIIFEEDIWKFMGMSINTDLDFENYIGSTLKALDKGICRPFLIVDKTTNRIAGSTRYGYLNAASQKCEIGWTWLGKDFQGTGLNKACKYELLNYGFENIAFRRIQFSADQKNLRSQSAIEKLGAKKEGLFRNNYIDANGISRNDVYYSIIQEEWPLLKIKNFCEFS